MEEGTTETPTEIKPQPVDFFRTDRGERAAYKAAGPDDVILLPVTRDGFEALIEEATTSFTPPLPMDDSIRKVLAGYVHHLTNETSTTTKAKIGAVLFKSISNALTWTIDQEIKAKAQEEQRQQQARIDAFEKQRKLELAKEKRSLKLLKKSTKNGENEKSIS